MTFIKSYFGMCMIARGHFITIKIFPGGIQRSKGMSKEAAAAPAPSLAPPMQVTNQTRFLVNSTIVTKIQTKKSVI